MTEPLPDTWHTREIHVLRHIVAESDKERPHDMTAGEISNRMNVDGQPWYDLRLVLAALKTLERGGFVTMDWRHGIGGQVDPAESRVIDFDARAYGLTGMWPSPEAGAQHLITVLEQIAANTENSDDTRTRAEKIKELLIGSGQQLAVTVAAALITRGIQ